LRLIVAKGNLEAAVSFDFGKAETALQKLILIATSASDNTWRDLPRPNANSTIPMKSVVQKHKSHMQGILMDFRESTGYVSEGSESRRDFNFRNVNETAMEMLKTLRLMCDELQNYLEVVPGVVQKQLLLCETVDVMVGQMRSTGMGEQADSVVDATKDVLGHVVS
jgi:hypothetical protein